METSPAPGSRPDLFVAPRKETETPQIVYYAGRSPKRRAFLEHVSGRHVMSVGGGNENNRLDPNQVAAGKIDYALARLTAEGKLGNGKRTLVVAADIQVHSPALAPDGRTVIETQGKMEEIRDVKKVFQGMKNAASATGDNRHYGYIIVAASEARTITGDEITIELPAPSLFYVGLQKEAVDYFATEEGSREYLDNVSAFLRSRNYVSNGVAERCSALDICGGLELAVLQRFNAIRKINTTKQADPAFEHELRRGLAAAHVGFDEAVLNLISATAQERAGQWPWFRKVMSYALGKAA